MGVSPKDVAGTLLSMGTGSYLDGSKLATAITKDDQGGDTAVAGKNKPINAPIGEQHLKPNRTIYSNRSNANQYKSKNYKIATKAPGKDASVFEIKDLLKTSIRNDIAIKKEAAELRRKEISELRENLEIQYALAEESELIERHRQLIEKGPEKAPEAKMISGLYYQFTLRLLVLKDVIDFFWDIATLATAVTVVIAFALWFLKILYTVFMYVFVTVFNKINGLSFSLKQWLLFRIIPVILECIPAIGSLPLGSASFAYSVINENIFRKKKEKELQSLLNEKHKIEIKFIEDRLSSSENKNIVRVNQKNTTQSITTKPKESKTQNSWKEMVEGSNQNITKPNTQTRPNLKTA